MGEIVARNM